MNASPLEKGLADDRVRPSLENNGVPPTPGIRSHFSIPFAHFSRGLCGFDFAISILQN